METKKDYYLKKVYNMNRYHIKIYTKPEHWQLLEGITNNLNSLDWQYTKHCLDNLKHRVSDLEKLLLYVKNTTLNISQIFEYYFDDNNNIEKLCYRIKYNEYQDIILIIGKDKQIITIYLNNKDDLHFTLKKELYING